jgi:hypothetical protein
MYAPDDPFAVRRPAPPSEADATVDEAGVTPQADPVTVDAPARPESFEPDIELLDRAEATDAGATRVIDLVDGGALDQAESLLDSLVTPSSE